MNPLAKRKGPTLGQVVFGEVVGPVDDDEDSDHPLRVDRIEPDDMEVKDPPPGGQLRDAFAGEDGDEVLTGDAGNDSLRPYNPMRPAVGKSNHSRSLDWATGSINGGDNDTFPDVAGILSPTDDPVDEQALYKFLQFDPKGAGQTLQAIYDQFSYKLSNRNLPSQLAFAAAATNAMSSIKEVEELYKRNKFHEIKDIYINPNDSGFNDAIDAFRHALWSFKMARDVGPQDARNWGNAHEVEEESVPGERLMDLYNNNVGHRLAMDPRNKGREPKDVIMEALKNGLLQTRPFKIRQR